LFAWIHYRGLHRSTWYGWSFREALSEWKEFFKLGLPGAAMVCAEWWGFEIHALVSGLLGTVPLAAQTLCLNTVSISFMIPLGIGIAATTRVGNLMGANKPHTAALFYRVAIWSGIVGAIFESIIFLIVRKQWG
jgi:MATE family multidrug resistance protein